MNKSYCRRLAETAFLEAIKTDPVLVLTGARQTGKSTLLRHALSADVWRYLTCDQFDVLRQIEQDPMALLADPRPLIIDEVQRAPGVLSAIKQLVDVDRQARRFVLSGSANLLLMQQVTESLAGRATFLHLDPLTQCEVARRPRHTGLDDCFAGNPPRCAQPGRVKDWPARIWRGWFPVPALSLTGNAVTRWLDGYVTSYVERDLRQLSQIDSLTDFRRLMQALALRSGTLLNQSEVGRDLGIKQPTVHRYCNLLESSCLLHRLPVYAVNRTLRLIKTPKPYWLDSGLAAHLAGCVDAADIDHTLWGRLVETAVLQHLRVWCELQTPKARISYWRTVSGHEVDFVIEWGRKLVAVEVKATSLPQYTHADDLRLFLGEYSEATAGLVVHLGTETTQLDTNIYAVPFANIL